MLLVIQNIKLIFMIILLIYMFTALVICLHVPYDESIDYIHPLKMEKKNVPLSLICYYTQLWLQYNPHTQQRNKRRQCCTASKWFVAVNRRLVVKQNIGLRPMSGHEKCQLLGLGIFSNRLILQCKKTNCDIYYYYYITHGESDIFYFKYNR